MSITHFCSVSAVSDLDSDIFIANGDITGSRDTAVEFGASQARLIFNTDGSSDKQENLNVNSDNLLTTTYDTETWIKTQPVVDIADDYQLFATIVSETGSVSATIVGIFDAWTNMNSLSTYGASIDGSEETSNAIVEISFSIRDISTQIIRATGTINLNVSLFESP